MRLYALLICLLSLGACKRYSRVLLLSVALLMAGLSGFLTPIPFESVLNQKRHIPAPNQFQIPTVFQPDAPLPLALQEKQAMQAIYPQFLGSFPFAKTLPIQTDLPWPSDEEYLLHSQDSLDYYPGAGLQLVPDPTIHLALADKNRMDNSAFFPVFLVNENNTIHALQGKDSRVFAIQEALDSSGTWRPIEMQAWGFCANGFWVRKIKPKHFAVFLLPKYTGDFTTQLRVRLRNGAQTLISQPYPGSISYQQFYLPEDEIFAFNGYQRRPESIISDCLGSIPLELASKFTR